MKKIKVYGDGGWINNSESSSFEKADIVVMPGGEDWNPNIYGHRPMQGAYWKAALDRLHLALMNEAINYGKLLFGICRGFQGVCIRAGGKLIQDVSHPAMHMIKTHDGEDYLMNSSHHQMVYPYEMPKKEYEVLGWTEQLSPFFKFNGGHPLSFPDHSLDDNGKFKEPEVAWFPKIRALGCQGHPEWSDGRGGIEFLNKLILEKL